MRRVSKDKASAKLTHYPNFQGNRVRTRSAWRPRARVAASPRRVGATQKRKSFRLGAGSRMRPVSLRQVFKEFDSADAGRSK
jgi:hypothetical protein